jgi:hypothetical protein
MARVKMRWSGFNGGPGYSIFHFRDFSGSGSVDLAAVNGALTKTQAFANAIKGLVAHTVTFQVENDVEVIEDTTGQLQNVITGTAQAAVVSTGATGTYSAATGAVVTWRTGGVRNGRRVRGRTFLVPFASAAYQTDGTLSTTAVTTLQTAATAMIDATGAGDLGVYGRPSGPGATDGVWYAASGFTVPDMVAVLKSRRT